MSEEEEARAEQNWSHVPTRKISTYRIFISHRYVHSEEYRRLVQMLNRAAEDDAKWHWRNCSIPQESPIMTAAEALRAEVFEERLRTRISQVHAVLYILRDDWLAEMGSLYHELVESTRLRYGIPIPIISVLPRGADPQALHYRAPGLATVKWHSPSIIKAVREHALPVFKSEMRLSSTESTERDQIVETLRRTGGSMAKTSAALGMSKRILQQKILTYIIR